MQILIKGMEMPKNCKDCACYVHRSDPGYYDFDLCQASKTVFNDDAREINPYEMRLANCPLVEVPTPHGPLKDADELKDWLQAWFVMLRSYHPYSKSNLIPSTEIVDIIDRLPTIIETEKGE